MRRFGLDKVNIGTTGRLAMYETSCLDIGENLIKEVFVKAAEASLNMGLDRFKSQGKLMVTTWFIFPTASNDGIVIQSDLANTCW